MNSRDRLRDGVAIRYEIEKQLEELIRNHPGLRALREQRRREEIENKLQDSKPLAEVIENIIKKSPALSKLFLEGVRIRNPFNLVDTKVSTKFTGKRFPSYFRLSKQYPKENPKFCPINGRYRIQFETDAENEYFNRDREPGQFSIAFNDHVIQDFALNLWNGLATLTVELPSDIKVGDILFFKTEITDNSRVEPFYNEFYVKVGEKEEKQSGGGGKIKLPPDGNDSEEIRKIPSSLDLPTVIELRKNDSNWKEHFHSKEDSRDDDAGALSIKDAGDNGYDFFINMDNVYLQTEVKGNTKIDHRLLEARFNYGMVLVGISLLDYFEKKESEKSKTEEPNDASMFKKIYQLSKAISPILLPMISSLGDLEIES